MGAKQIEFISPIIASGYSKMNPEIVAYAERVSILVRCKDCKYLSKDEIAPEFYRICKRYGVGKPDNGFCDEAERSEDA